MDKRAVYDAAYKRVYQLFDNNFQRIKKSDQHFFEPLTKRGYYPAIVHIWSSITIEFDSYRSSADYYEVNLNNDDIAETICQCVNAWFDNRERELNERKAAMPIEDVMRVLLEHTQQCLQGTDYVASIQHGKRTYDKDTFDAIVIDDNDCAYLMMFYVSQNRFYEYTITSAVAGCGECEYKAGLSVDTMKNFITNELSFITTKS